jgi:phospholipase C
VAGDLTSVFNFANPNAAPVSLPSTTGFLPPTAELDGAGGTTFIPSLNSVVPGVPAQEKGIRPARALPYELDVHAAVNASNNTVTLTFVNTGNATVVFHVRSGNAADPVRYYTVEPGKSLAGTWNITSPVTSPYNLSVYGPNGFVRYFNGGIGSSAAILDVVTRYNIGQGPNIGWNITNFGSTEAEVIVLDAYTGNLLTTRVLHPHATVVDKLSLDQFFGWYDLIVTVGGDPAFKYRLAGHVETGEDSYSDPALGGLVALKG